MTLKGISNKEVKNAGWIVGGKIAHMLLSFFVGLVTTRYLGPNNSGIIGYASAYIALFSSLCTLGINSVIIKDFVDNPEDQGKAIGSAIILRGASSLLSAIMIVSFVGIVDRSEPVTVIVTALCSVSLLFNAFDTINFWFQSRYESKVTAIATFVGYVAVSGYRIVLLIFNKNVKWFALASSIDYIVIATVLYFAYKRANGPKLEYSWTVGKRLLSKSYHYILSGMMVAIYGQTDKLMLKQMLNSSEVGYYTVATTICALWVFVLQAIIDSMLPTIMRLYRENKELYERKNRQLYAIVFYMSVIASLVFMLFGDFIVKLLYGTEYEPSVMPLKVITWYTAFSYLGVARNAWMVCENKQKFLKYIYFGAAVLNVGFNFLMIPLLGATGAAAASLITQVCTSIILPMLIKDMRPNVKLMAEAVILRKTFGEN